MASGKPGAVQSLRIKGVAQTATAYALVSVEYRFPKNTVIAVRGRLRRGGATFGVLNEDESAWEATLTRPLGEFTALLAIPRTGNYHIMVTNNISSSDRYNDLEIFDIGLVGTDPSKFLAKLPQ
jgi:hypothetical protein